MGRAIPVMQPTCRMNTILRLCTLSLQSALVLLMGLSSAWGSIPHPADPVVANNPGELASELASRVASLAASSGTEFRVALSGGSALQLLSDGLILRQNDVPLRLSQWKIYLVDERCVDVSDPASNFNAVRSMVNKLGLSQDQIIPSANMLTTSLSRGCSVVAQEYDQILRETPEFDLVILGMGSDGHTASIFPGSDVDAGVLSAFYEPASPKPPSERISISMRLINSATNVLVVATGASKRHALSQALCTRNPKLPIGRVQPNSGNLVYFMDREAAPMECLTGQHFVWFGSTGSLAKKYTWTMLSALHRKGSMHNTLVHAIGSKPVDQGADMMR